LVKASEKSRPKSPVLKHGSELPSKGARERGKIYEKKSVTNKLSVATILSYNINYSVVKKE
jgi:hypothetical protein